MLVPPEVRKCVAFIGYRDEANEPRLVGTAFFVALELDELGVPEHAAICLVTAQHLVDKIRLKGGRGVVRMNIAGKGAMWFDVDAAHFYSHPNHPAFEAVDVAVAPIRIPQSLEYLSIQTKTFVTDAGIAKHRIGVGDEVFVSGLFWNHRGIERNLPIVRIGNIAGMPEEQVASKFGLIDAYLVEARSIGGLSGSPVFVHLGIARAYDKNVMLAQNTDYGVFYLMGVMQGHWDSNGLLPVDEVPLDDEFGQERVNMGIAIVTPIQKVLEVLMRPEIQEHKKRVADIVRRKLESEKPVMDTLPDRTRS